MPFKKSTYLVFSLTFLNLFIGYGQHVAVETYRADSILKRYGEVYLYIPLRIEDGLINLSDLGSVDAVYEDSARICITPTQFKKITALGIPFRVYELKRPEDRKATTESWQGWNSYPSYQQYDSVMRKYAVDYPSICRLDTIGPTGENRLLLVLKISDNVEIDEPEPEFMYSSSIHGDETGGYILLLRFINYLLTRYGSDTLVTALVNGMEFWICPLTNPDGTYRGGDNSVSGAVRFNASGVDLNRNFPDPQDGPHPDGNDYQPETLAMMAFHEKRHIGISVNFHAGDEVVNYPWDTWSQRHADDAWFQRISRIYADTVHSHSTNYMTGFDDGITNGFDWYSINGGRQDYVTYFREGRESTIELDNSKITPEDELDTLWEYNYRSLLYYARQALFGVRGFVSDAVTGKPVVAMLDIPEHDAQHSEVSSDSVYGYFHRYLAAGVYDFIFSAEGYLPDTLLDAEVLNDQLLPLSVTLTPVSTEIPVQQVTMDRVFPNPVTRGANVTLVIHSSGIYRYALVNIQGKVVDSGVIHIPSSGHKLFLNTADLVSGTYFIIMEGDKDRIFLKMIVLP